MLAFTRLPRSASWINWTIKYTLWKHSMSIPIFLSFLPPLSCPHLIPPQGLSSMPETWWSPRDLVFLRGLLYLCPQSQSPKSSHGFWKEVSFEGLSLMSQGRMSQETQAVNCGELWWTVVIICLFKFID